MTRNEMFTRLASLTEAQRIAMYQAARDGHSGYAVAGYDRANIKAANAVCAWADKFGPIVPTDDTVTATL